MVEYSRMNEQKYDVEQLLKQGIPVSFPIRGWSMYPFLSDGDMVTVEPLEEHIPSVNDAILYRRINGPLVLHRLMKIDHKGYYFCGDNQTEIEGPLNRSQLLGILVSYTHNGKQVQSADSSYQLLTSVWRHMRPLRPVISKTVHKLKSH